MKLVAVYVDNVEFLTLANNETEALPSKLRKYDRPECLESEQLDRRMARIMLSMACDAYGDPSVIGILADLLEDWDYRHLACQVRGDVSWLGRLKLLTLAGSSARAYYAKVFTTIGRLASMIANDRLYQRNVTGYPPGTDLGIPPDGELPGYPAHREPGTVAVPDPSLVGMYQTTWPHVRRLMLAGLAGQVVSDDVGQVAQKIQDVLHDELTLNRRIPWVSRLSTIGVT